MSRRLTDYFYLLQYFPLNSSKFLSYFLPSSSLPFISSIDLLEEIIILYNPSSSSFFLENFTLSDSYKKHIYKFPESSKISSFSFLVVDCCPGKRKEIEEKEDYLLWRNNDGTLRKKEVLNNGKKNREKERENK